MVRLVPIALALIFSWSAGAQSPADWWYFGLSAGVHFTSSGVVADTNSSMTTDEGCAVLSTYDGDLLFYTDGTFVWNRDHDQMPNGYGLLGNFSSTQSAIILPVIGSTTRYYVFTVHANSSVGLHYSVVDMSLNTGFGDVDTSMKNVFLIDSLGEKLTAIAKNNGTGYWVLVHKLQGTTYYAFDVTVNGVDTTPVVSNGAYDYNSFCRGYIKSNVDGTVLASGIYEGPGGVDLSQFNQATGQVFNSIHINGTSYASGNNGYAYGIEFSPNDSLLYTGNNSSIWQFNISNWSASAIEASAYQVPGVDIAMALQLGPDGKIYHPENFDSYLGVINDPDVQGSGCNYVSNAVDLLTGTARIGLPTFSQSFFAASFSFEGKCLGDSFAFHSDSARLDSVIWDFGDPISGAWNQSKKFHPKHLFTDTGWFSVSLIAHADSLVDTVHRLVYVYPMPYLDLGNDTTVCISDTLMFEITQPYSTYLWSDGATNDTFELVIDSTTRVSATIFSVCDTVSDTIHIEMHDPIELELGPDTLICGEAFHVIVPKVEPHTLIQWNVGSFGDSLAVTEGGLYIAEASNACSLAKDTIRVSFYSLPVAVLPNDTTNCLDQSFVLSRPDIDSVTYTWSDSSNGRTFIVDSTQLVWLAASNKCGDAIDSIRVIFNGEVLVELGEDTTICGDSIAITASWPDATYAWNTGDTADTIWATETNNYVVTITKGACQYIESMGVEVGEQFCPDMDCNVHHYNVFSPNADGVNDLWRVTSDCEFGAFTVWIYNRWGELVHQSSNARFGWDGSINGQPANEGTYYFEVDYQYKAAVDADRHTYRGSLSLIR